MLLWPSRPRRELRSPRRPRSEALADVLEAGPTTDASVVHERAHAARDAVGALRNDFSSRRTVRPGRAVD